MLLLTCVSGGCVHHLYRCSTSVPCSANTNCWPSCHRAESPLYLLATLFECILLAALIPHPCGCLCPGHGPAWLGLAGLAMLRHNDNIGQVTIHFSATITGATVQPQTFVLEVLWRGMVRRGSGCVDRSQRRIYSRFQKHFSSSTLLCSGISC